MINVKYVKGGIATNFGNYIEMNKNLLKYPLLHHQILAHEIRHESMDFNRKDFVKDITEKAVDQWSLLKFMFRHPRSWSHFFPISNHSGKWTYDPNAILIWVIMFIIIGVGVGIGVSL